MLLQSTTDLCPLSCANMHLAHSPCYDLGENSDKCFCCCCRALRRSRHHCRLCGGIFCAACTSKALLLPPKFQEKQPKRLCDPCAELLEPLHPFLAGAEYCKLIEPFTVMQALLQRFNLWAAGAILLRAVCSIFHAQELLKLL